MYKTRLTDPNIYFTVEEIRNNLEVSNDVLFVRHNNENKVVIPMKDREEYIIETHLDPMLGHPSDKNLIDKEREEFIVQNKSDRLR